MYCPFYAFFFSSRRRHTRLQGDWSSDVCSSDLYDTANYIGDVHRPLAAGGSRLHEIHSTPRKRGPGSALFAFGGCAPPEKYFRNPMIHITLPDGSQREYPGPVTVAEVAASIGTGLAKDRKSTRLNSSHLVISYA